MHKCNCRHCTNVVDVEQATALKRSKVTGRGGTAYGLTINTVFALSGVMTTTPTMWKCVTTINQRKVCKA